MFLFEDDFTMRKTVSRGVTYITVGFFSGSKDIFQKIEELIRSDFETTNVDEIQSENLCSSGIAIAEDLEYCVQSEGGEEHDE